MIYATTILTFTGMSVALSLRAGRGLAIGKNLSVHERCFCNKQQPVKTTFTE